MNKEQKIFWNNFKFWLFIGFIYAIIHKAITSDIMLIIVPLSIIGMIMSSVQTYQELKEIKVEIKK